MTIGHSEQPVFVQKVLSRSLSQPRSPVFIHDIADEKQMLENDHQEQSVRLRSTSLPKDLTQSVSNLSSDELQSITLKWRAEESPITTDTLPFNDMPMLECPICMIEKPLDEYDGIYSDECQHVERSVCSSCVYDYVKTAVEDWSMYEGQMKCPEPTCNGMFDFYTIRSILLSTGRDHHVFEHYDDRLIQCRLAEMTEFVWCAHECGSGQLHDISGAPNMAVACIKCKRQTCFKHRIIWHTDVSCEDYDILKALPEQEANARWLTINSKQCPNCTWHIQKNEGCDHMTCRSCKHEFCWECMVNYKLIADRGQSQHRNTCSHYQAPPVPPPVETPVVQVPVANVTTAPATPPRPRQSRRRCAVQ